MSEDKERSGIFKFFYVIISIITFPIFAVLFILRHPFLILFILLLIGGGAAYYPISQGVKPDEVLTWYQAKFTDVKKEVVAKAAENGATNLVPQVLLDDVKKIEEEEAEALLPKGENYNKKVIRDSKAEETKAKLKKRGGFKKQVNDEENKEIPSETKQEKVTEQSDELKETGEVDVLEKSGEQVGGLSAFIKSVKEPIEETVEEANEEKATTQDVVGEDAVAEEKKSDDNQGDDDILDLGDDEVSDVVEEKTVEVKEEEVDMKPVLPAEPEKKIEKTEEDDDLELEF